MVEIEAELQAELEYIQMDFLQSNSKHQRSTSGSSEVSFMVILYFRFIMILLGLSNSVDV